MSAKSTAEAIVHALQPPSVLMVLTSNSKLGRDSKAGVTGWYLPEAAHPNAVFEAAGVEMTWASPKGGEAPVDPDSVKAYEKDDEAVDFLKNNDAWKHTKALNDVDPKAFDAVFVVGGYGVMWDLVKNTNLHEIAASIYDAGGVVSGVCHGPAALVDVKLKDGSSLVKGKEVACFSNAEEDVVKRRDVVPQTCEDALKDAGADYKDAKPWKDHVATAGRLITGQNPMSAKSTAEAVLYALHYRDGDRYAEKFENKKEAVSLTMQSAGNGAVIFAACGLIFFSLAFIVVRARRAGSTALYPERELLPLVEEGEMSS
jgi:putative intracellular protease/amidase